MLSKLAAGGYPDAATAAAAMAARTQVRWGGKREAVMRCRDGEKWSREEEDDAGASGG